MEAVHAVHNIYAGVGEPRRTRQDRQRAGRDLLRERFREAVPILLRELDGAQALRLGHREDVAQGPAGRPRS